ncbi:hypothetical protein ADK38_17190 [Streptomyces varsoviensis]|uniref:Uncharacterized protein n=1 Tax=Streptomyces varsoviensis TaxID=67373 RepID=A0ABR5J610_9ACTN|nr:hypothetical protein ADK38_17190 [Streptomyces varsoviensis]
MQGQEQDSDVVQVDGVGEEVDRGEGVEQGAPIGGFVLQGDARLFEDSAGADQPDRQKRGQGEHRYGRQYGQCEESLQLGAQTALLRGDAAGSGAYVACGRRS